jgi:mannose-1-phosphate guanylyltransferase
VKAVVLVGGEGTRLRPLTLSTPKQMLPVVGQPMIERVLGHLAGHGIDEAVLSLGYLPDAFLRAYPDATVAGVRLSYATEPEPLDTAGAVRFAADHAGIDETFIVVNGDVLTDMDVSALVAFHRDRRAEGTIALHPVDDPSAYGVVPIDEDGRVTAFVEKPPRDEAPTNQINAGTYVLEPSFLQRVPLGRRVSIERETFPAMVREGSLYARSDDAYWLDTGNPSDYLQAHRDLVEGRRGVPPSPGASRRGDGLWVRGSPKVDGTVVGACYVADGAEVAEGSRIESSVLGEGSVVEAGATVSRSVLLAGARVAARSTVVGSVLGPGATVGMRCEVRPVSVLGAGVVVPSGTMVDGERVPPA